MSEPGSFEGAETILVLLHKATLLVFNGHIKEICTATLSSKEGIENASQVVPALYITSCGWSLQKAYDGESSFLLHENQ